MALGFLPSVAMKVTVPLVSGWPLTLTVPETRPIVGPPEPQPEAKTPRARREAKPQAAAEAGGM